MKSKVSPSTFHLSILERDLTPTMFYPYTTFVQNRILEAEIPEDAGDPFIKFCIAIQEKVQKMGVRWDNKVAIRLDMLFDAEGYEGGHVYLGYCDNKWSLGLSIWSPDSKYGSWKSSIVKLH